MCGRYVLALRAALVRQMLQDENMDAYEVPPDDGPGAPRQSYNFAPGYFGIVYRADVPDWGAGPRREHGGSPSKKTKSRTAGVDDLSATASTASNTDAELAAASSHTSHAGEANTIAPKETRYKLQSMKWGLVPFWTKRNPDYATVMKTINCRDDSLASPGGMWASMKGRKRCVVVAQGFFEWLKPGGPGSRDKIPHYVRRRDGKLMCFAGLWDCVVYEDDRTARDEGGDVDEDARKNYTYTIITTDSNKQLKFLHDRMPVILEPGSEDLRKWLDPGRYEWTRELQALLKPWGGELEIYPVSKEVGKVGNNSPSFIVPVASKENKSNIANFFANANAKKGGGGGTGTTGDVKVEPEVEVKKRITSPSSSPTKTETMSLEEASKSKTNPAVKREVSPSPSRAEPPTKRIATRTSDKIGGMKLYSSPTKEKPKPAAGRGKISATSNGTKSPAKGKQEGSQKITKFFANSA